MLDPKCLGLGCLGLGLQFRLDNRKEIVQVILLFLYRILQSFQVGADEVHLCLVVLQCL